MRSMGFNRFFLDTSYVLALLNSRDVYHNRSKELFPLMRNAREVWITEAVLAEIGNALSRSSRLAAVNFINNCYITANVKVVSVNKDLFHRAIKFYQFYQDKNWGLTDCISFIVMQDHDLTEAFTADEHFKQAGFQPLLLK